MIRAIWINDIHLEFLSNENLQSFLSELQQQDADCLLVGGDIAQAPSLLYYLKKMQESLTLQIYFVLGNHDYYFGSIEKVRTNLKEFVHTSHNLFWLHNSGVVKLTEKTALIGHEGWGDGRLGEFYQSHVQLNDFKLIAELKRLSKKRLLQKIQTLGEEGASHLKKVLPEALSNSEHIVVLTHVPPFREASLYKGKPGNAHWLPFFACKATGTVLKNAMIQHPHKKMTVLCGHTHGGGKTQILPNLIVYTGAAVYGSPVIQKVFEWE